MNALLIAAAILGAPPHAGDVVDCALTLPPDIAPLGGMPVEARERALKERGAVVDRPNGFLSFSTDWTDAGWTDPYTIQVAVFRRGDGKYVAGVSNSRGQSPDEVPMSGVGFYAYTDGAWTDVTSEVLPSITLADVWTSRKKPPARPDAYLFLSFDLPRTGTNVNVSLQVFVPHHVDDGQQDISTAEDRARYARIEKTVADSSRGLTLAWNARRGVFTLKR